MQLIVNEDKKEVKRHGNYEFPVLISHERLSTYDSGSFLCHWHHEIELTYILSGNMYYQINGSVFHLKTNDALFSNSNTLHSGYMYNDMDCSYLSITFDPKIIFGFENSLIHTKYCEPILHNSFLPYIVFNHSQEWHSEIINHISTLMQLDDVKENLYEYKIQLELQTIWLKIIEHESEHVKVTQRIDKRDLERIKLILSFINSNYSQKISLEDIAKEINLCKSECCRLFKKSMNESLFSYLLHYRIEKSLPYLITGTQSITEIAACVGFDDPNYYAKIFRRLQGCSPHNYRKMHQGSYKS